MTDDWQLKLFFTNQLLGFQFEQQEVDPSKFIVLAQPLSRGYKLLILEQIADSRACWSESGISPVTVDLGC
jgi:hypothetical protein